MDPEQILERLLREMDPLRHVVPDTLREEPFTEWHLTYLTSIARLVRMTTERALEHLELTPAQYAALAQLDDRVGRTSAELARACRVTPQSMHKIVVHLERRGLLRREHDPFAPKAQPLSLTRTGREALVACHEAMVHVEHDFRRTFSDDERLQLHRLLGRTVNTLAAISSGL